MKNNAATLFTIVICTFNNAKMLRRTLESVNSVVIHDASLVEILVIDNNSRDETSAVCAQFSRVSRFLFRSVFETQQGLSNARNRALAEARDGVIIFTDDDVVVEPRWLEEYMAEYKDPDVDAVFGPIMPEWGGAAPSWYDERYRASYALLDYGATRFVVTMPQHPFFGANFSCRTKWIKEFGGFDPRLGRMGDRLAVGEETELFDWLLQTRRAVIYNPRILVWHIIREDRKNKDFLRRHYRDSGQSVALVTQKRARRTLFGIPYYQYKSFLMFFSLFPTQYVYATLRCRNNESFWLALKMSRYLAMLRTYLSEYARQRRL